MSNLESLHTVSLRRAKELTIQILAAGLVPNIEGPPGCGKSAIIHQIGEDGDLEVIDHRMSTSAPEDMSGLPQFTPEGFARFAPFVDIFPVKGIAKPKGNGYILFLDEFNSASREVQAAAYKPVLDHKIGQYDLHPDCSIVLAGNRKKDRAITNDLSTAMQSRLIHLEVEVNFQEWLEDVALPQNFDSRLIAFLSQHPSKLMQFNPQSTEKTFGCPRTWEFVNKHLSVSGTRKALPSNDTPLYTGTVGQGLGVDFVQFTAVYNQIISVRDVVSDPTGMPVPYELNLRWATVTAMVEGVKQETYKAIDTYIRRFDLSFRVLFNRMAVARNPKLRNDPIWSAHQVEIQRVMHGN